MKNITREQIFLTILPTVLANILEMDPQGGPVNQAQKAATRAKQMAEIIEKEATK